jgi:hypothetical protein
MATQTKSIAELAYELWEARGSPEGSPEQDWFEAERRIEQSAAVAPPVSKNEDEASIESFPASDPPASRIPDVPPSNAADKWQASRGDKSDIDRR